MDDHERLVAIEQIKALKARYFRYLDTRNWVGMRMIFTTDAVFDARASGGDDGGATGAEVVRDSNEWLYEGREVIAKFIEAAVGDTVTAHHGHGHEIEIHSSEQASGVIAMEDRIWSAKGDAKAMLLHGYGHYVEEYRKEGAAWRIARSKLTRLNVILN